MPIIFQYLLKLSFSLGIVYLFYQLLLRRLTFYNCNRFYLLGYTALCFIIPLINITPALETNQWQAGKIANIIPAWQLTRTDTNSITTAAIITPSRNYWTILAVLLFLGTIVLATVFLIRYLSFRRIRKQARLLSGGEMKVYQVDKNIIPFSFGNAIFINHTLHNEEELKEIIRHEFVHVRQKHSFDIVWAELLCMINWYNPFVWLLRKSIRQNLEFIADQQVIQSGFDKKQYQYMLLKVIGSNHFSIANQFNFSSLKKRIAMMNKVQTSRRQLLRLLLLLPAVAILLLAFRQKTFNRDTVLPKAITAPVGTPVAIVAASPAADQPAAAILDTIPFINEKGYQITVKAAKGNGTVIVKDKSGREIKKIALTDWNKNQEYFEDLYGEVPPPPPPMPPAAPGLAAVPPPAPVAGETPALPAAPAAPEGAPAAAPAPDDATYPVPPAPPVPPAIKLRGNAKSISVTNGQATVIDRNNKKETYNLNNAAEKAAFEKKYGELPTPPAGPVAREISEAKKSELNFIDRHGSVEKISWSTMEQSSPVFTTTDLPKSGAKKGDIFIHLHFRNGKSDLYNISNATDRARFKKTYGETPPIPPAEYGC